VFIASEPSWAAKFRDAGLPIVGDDIKSQVGATIVHRTLARCAKLALARGLGGPVDPACRYFMKSPPTQAHDNVARDSLDAFIAGRDLGVIHGSVRLE
jgi:myo-inositol-1-phosphate synthase